MKMLAAWITALGLLLAAPAQARVGTRAPGLVWKVTYNHPRSALLRFFRDYYQREDTGRKDGTPLHPDTFLNIATLRLADRYTELSLILVEGSICGSGGCTMDMVLTRNRGQSFDRLGTVGLLDPPVRVLPTSHHGLPDLMVDVDDAPPIKEGHPPDRAMVLIFDGRHHPEDIERRLSYRMAYHAARRMGRVVIPVSDTKSTIRLYPHVKEVAGQ